MFCVNAICRSVCWHGTLILLIPPKSEKETSCFHPIIPGKLAQGKEGGVYGAQGNASLIIKQFKKTKAVSTLEKEYR
jgi:hypothetical protein